MNTIFKIFLLLFLTSNIYGLTLGNIRDESRALLHDVSTDTAKQRWSNTRFNFVINQGQREMCDVVWSVHNSTTIALLKDTTYYTLPDDLYAIERVVYNGVTVLTEKTITSFDRDDTSWLATSTGTPENFYVSVDNKKIGFYPVPDNSALANIYIDFIKIPSDLSSDSDIPFDNVFKYKSYHHLLIYYTVAMINLEESNQTWKDFYYLYDLGLKRMAEKIGIYPSGYTPTLKFQRE